jgi:hypothetical protein
MVRLVFEGKANPGGAGIVVEGKANPGVVGIVVEGKANPWGVGIVVEYIRAGVTNAQIRPEMAKTA